MAKEFDREFIEMTDKYAYERGLADGRKGVGAGENPYAEPDSRHYQYSVGYAGGYAETHEDDEDTAAPQETPQP